MMVNEEFRLDLAHQNLKYMPKSLFKNYREVVQIIDLSYNQIR